MNKPTQRYWANTTEYPAPWCNMTTLELRALETKHKLTVSSDPSSPLTLEAIWKVKAYRRSHPSRDMELRNGASRWAGDKLVKETVAQARAAREAQWAMEDDTLAPGEIDGLELF